MLFTAQTTSGTQRTQVFPIVYKGEQDLHNVLGHDNRGLIYSDFLTGLNIAAE